MARREADTYDPRYHFYLVLQINRTVIDLTYIARQTKAYLLIFISVP